jgi:hypothetical protein
MRRGLLLGVRQSDLSNPKTKILISKQDVKAYH